MPAFMNFGDERLPMNFWDKAIPEPNTSCWLWIAATDTWGYGVFQLGTRPNRKRWMAHRLTYSFVAPLPDYKQYNDPKRDLELDHKCRVRCCINPFHLDLVTGLINTLRSEAFAAVNARKTACPNGHAYIPENTYMYRGQRRCRHCAANFQRELRRKRGAQSRSTTEKQ